MMSFFLQQGSGICIEMTEHAKPLKMQELSVEQLGSSSFRMAPVEPALLFWKCTVAALNI
jgi:hypothetical protein